MKLFACPYCDKDLTGVHREVTRSAPHADKFAVLCVWCGEPVFIDGERFRKPSDEEFGELVAQPKYHQSRGAWMEMNRRRQEKEPMHLHGMWLKFREQALAGVTDNGQLNYSMHCFLSGVAMAMAYFKYIGGMEMDDFAARLELFEAELEAYKEVVEETNQRMN